MFCKKNLFLAFICILFFSCSNSPDTNLISIDDETLKIIITNKESNVLWTNELEGDRLTKSLKDFDFIDSAVLPSTDLFKSLSNYQQKIFPSLEDFGSLDFSSVPLPLTAAITDFGKALCSENAADAESFFEKNYVFNYVFFNERRKEYHFEKIDKFVAAKPYFLDGVIKVPLRIYSGKHYADLMLYIKDTSEYKIYNICFIKKVVIDE